MNTLTTLLVVCVVACLSSLYARAETILFESATLGHTGIPIAELLNQNVPGTNVSPTVYAGVRFQLHQPVVTSQVGGHFVANSGGTLFGAIVELEDENDFPDSGDFMTDDILGSTVLTFPTPSSEVFGDIELTLDPGWYALVFGSGRFETLGSGVAVRNGVAIGSPTHIAGSPSTPDVWSDFTTIHRGNRFVLRGRIVPEPTTATLTCIGGLLIYFCRRLHLA